MIFSHARQRPSFAQFRAVSPDCGCTANEQQRAETTRAVMIGVATGTLVYFTTKILEGIFSRKRKS